MHAQLSTIPKAQAKKLYLKGGLSLAAIASRFSIPKTTLCDMFRREGIPRRKPWQTRCHKAPTAELARLYFEQQLSPPMIAERLGLTKGAVLSRLIRAGYKLRPRGGQKGHLRCPRIKTAEIVRLKDEGLNYAKIAEKLHTSRALVMYRLTKVAGLTLAPIIDRNLSKKLPWDEIMALYSEQKVSVEKIAKRFKAGINTISRGLVKRDIEIRSKTAHVPAMWAERKQKLAAADHILAQQTQQQPRPPGRPKDPETDRKLELMAKLAVKEGQSLRAMSTLVFPDKRHTPEAAYASTRKLASDYRADLEAKKLAVAQV